MMMSVDGMTPMTSVMTVTAVLHGHHVVQH
jgi:hypothetical protein